MTSAIALLPIVLLHTRRSNRWSSQSTFFLKHSFARPAGLSTDTSRLYERGRVSESIGSIGVVRQREKTTYTFAHIAHHKQTNSWAPETRSLRPRCLYARATLRGLLQAPQVLFARSVSKDETDGRRHELDVIFRGRRSRFEDRTAGRLTDRPKNGIPQASPSTRAHEPAEDSQSTRAVNRISYSLIRGCQLPHEPYNPFATTNEESDGKTAQKSACNTNIIE